MFDALVGIENSLDQGNVDELAIGVIISQLVRSVEADYGSELIEFNGTTLDEARKSLQEVDTQLIQSAKIEVSKAALNNSHHLSVTLLDASRS